LSSQNLTFEPSLIKKVLKRRNSFLTFIRLAQKCESPLFHCTCESGLDPRYLLRNSCFQFPFVMSSWSNHLLRSALFFMSKSWIPRTPWSLGWYNVLHFARWYFCHSPSLCQKNLYRK
jgi:hypothetical protein